VISLCESLTQEYSSRRGLQRAWGLHHENGKHCARTERSSQGLEKVCLVMAQQTTGLCQETGTMYYNKWYQRCEKGDTFTECNEG